ncbi:PREDICTED: uncharacterized protein LOC109131324 [Camelina sativa]|uniref:Uncharacterized protein LOC109131324 n=1 Tax=Camelina sativa TaxID=90675 RepID=A0ABM1RFA9_CAMSA|nr:PREDICTED: uncharacterized protein LOC109131324 [Camelina sativa]
MLLVWKPLPSELLKTLTIGLSWQLRKGPRRFAGEVREGYREWSNQIRQHIWEARWFFNAMMMKAQANGIAKQVDDLVKDGFAIPAETIHFVVDGLAFWDSVVDGIEISPLVNDGYVVTRTAEHVAANPRRISSYDEVVNFDEYGSNMPSAATEIAEPKLPHRNDAEQAPDVEPQVMSKGTPERDIVTGLALADAAVALISEGIEGHVIQIPGLVSGVAVVDPLAPVPVTAPEGVSEVVPE